MHSIVLTTMSPYFKTALKTPLTDQKYKSMLVECCTFEVFVQAVNYMYGIDIAEDFSDLIGLMDIAELFLMPSLKNEVSLRLSETLNKSNYIEISLAAEKYNDKVLGEKIA